MIDPLTAAELAHRYLAFAFRTARKCCPRHLEDEAESVALVGLAEAVRNWPGDKKVCFPTWSGRIVKRRAFSLLRGDGRERRRYHFVVPRPLADPVPAWAIESDLEFDDLIACLAPIDRRLMRRMFVEGFDLYEASKQEGLSKTSGHRRYHAAIERIRNGMVAS